MEKRPAINSLANTESTTFLTQLNQNFSNVQIQFDNTLSLDGTTPNAMNADLDMNSNDILNAKSVNTSSLLLNGVEVVPSSVVSALNITTRSSFVSANVTNPGLNLNDGQVVTAGGYEYRRQVGSTAIPDLAGWVPNGEWDYKHFGAIGDGATNDAPAMQSAMTAAANRTITRSAGTYLLNSNVLGDLTQTEIIEPNANITGAGIVANRNVLRTHEGGGTTQTRRATAFFSETIGAYEEYRSLGTGGAYGRRTNYWQESAQTSGYSIGHAVIADFDGTDGGQGLASWFVSATPTSTTKTFGVFGQEINPINISSDMGYARKRSLLARWTGGVQVVAEAQNLTNGGPNIGRNTTFGFAVAPSLYANDLGKTVRTYNGFLAEEGSIAPAGRAFMASGSATAVDLPAFGLQVDAHFEAGIDTASATFSTGRALTVASGQLVQWGTTGLTVQLDGDSSAGRLDVEVAGNIQFRVERGAVTAVNYITARGNATTGAPNLTSEGTDTNIDLTLIAKGTGRIRFGAFTGTADAPITGYVEIKDQGGTTRRLAVVA
jgi:hypothetical protein